LCTAPIDDIYDISGCEAAILIFSAPIYILEPILIFSAPIFDIVGAERQFYNISAQQLLF